MFVWWKRRKKAPTKHGCPPRKRSDAGDSLYCVIVESQRIDGSPRQKVVSYLASVDENDCDKLWLRVDFWDYISAKLDRLPLSRRERTKIEEAIGKVVTRVPEEEAEQSHDSVSRPRSCPRKSYCRLLVLQQEMVGIATGSLWSQPQAFGRHQCATKGYSGSKRRMLLF